MPQNYYDTNTDYPEIILPIMERIRYYIRKEVLYTTEDYPTDITKDYKFIMADISDNAFRVSSKITKLPNFSIPITVYSIGEIEVNPSVLAPNAFLHITYSDTFNCIINSMASVFTVPMISIFNSAHDYTEAWTRLQIEDLKKTILEVPLIINGVSTTIPIFIDFDPAPVKGMYAFELEQQLGKGRINTIQHDLKVYFHNLVLDTGGIHPVDDIQVALASYSGSNYLDNISMGSGLVPTTPAISSTVPEDGATNVYVGSGITVNFNIAMNEDVTTSYIETDPYFWYETSWDTNSKILTITPNFNLSSGTVYTITILEEAESGDKVNLEEDYEFDFTTM